MGQINAGDLNPETNKAFAINPSSGVWDDNFFASKYGAANQADRQLQDSIAAPTNALATQKVNNQNFLAGQNATTGDFLNRYTGAVNGQEKTSALASRIGNELGLPQLQGNAQALNQTLFNLPQTYSKATTGFDVNANQLARVVGTKQAELAPAAALASQNAQAAQTNLNTRLGYEQTDQAKALLPYQTEQQLLSDRLARETTLYSQQNQSELDTLIARAQMGVALSTAEQDRIQQLALSEQNYKQQLSLQQDATKNSGGSGLTTLSEGQTIIDPATGRVVYTAPKTYKPGGASEGGWS